MCHLLYWVLGESEEQDQDAAFRGILLHQRDRGVHSSLCSRKIEATTEV